MEKSAREKIPTVVALLMGMVGMTVMMVTCYAVDSEPFNPREIAVKSAIAWGVMMAVGFVVGTISKRFIPDPPVRKAPVEKAEEEKKDEAASVGPTKATVPGPAGAIAEGGLDEAAALNLLLNEPPPDLSAAAKAAAASNPGAGGAAPAGMPGG